ncbi:MAG: GNAT family N-acetyltransferase, partial [Myxococcota bacterium]
AALAARCREVALRLRLAKLVWIQQAGGVRGAAGERISLADLAELRDLLDRPEGLDAAQRGVLEEVAVLLERGTPSVNLCSPEGLATELFTYAGSGTLFTKQRYIEVRALGLDDFDAAADLIRRGTEEGYLIPRSASEVELVLSHAFGVFIEGRYLAGIGSLLPYEPEGVAEIASLYTVTRFAREGVGGHLVSHALQTAHSAGIERVFACTISERVESFFVRHGFEHAAEEEIPEAKRLGHSPERLQQLRYLARSTATASG